jgi:hypothetical protein
VLLVVVCCWDEDGRWEMEKKLDEKEGVGCCLDKAGRRTARQAQVGRLGIATSPQRQQRYNQQEP